MPMSRVAGTMVACSSSVQVIAHSNQIQLPSLADASGKVMSCDASCQEVGRCSTRIGSQGIYITFASTKVNKAEPTLALKPRGHITRNPKEGYHWPQNRTCVCVHHIKKLLMPIARKVK